MAHGIIYMVHGDELRRMSPSAPESEDRMQELVARYPELITDGDGDLLLISREPAIGDGETASRWSLDHLFVTKSGVPVLVELKRASDTRIRREVVGQLIDYAANASAHWAAGTIAATFAKTVGLDQADELLGEFVGDRSPDEFWEQVDSNLRSGRIKLVFVADVIPRELAIVVEFLNAQMRADVRAVELRWFTGQGGVTTLTPRVIGETEQSTAAKRQSGHGPMELDAWIDERIVQHGDDTLAGVQTFCHLAAEAGGQVFIPATQGSIIASWSTNEGKTTYPVGVYPSGMVVLRLGYLKYRPAFASEEARKALYDRLTGLVGQLHTQSLAGEPGFAAHLLNDPAIVQAYAEFLQDVVASAKRSIMKQSPTESTLILHRN
jgi:hypothetical protein